MDQALAAIPDSLRTFGLEPAKGAIAKISYTHDGMIDEIIKNPHASQGQLAALFGYTAGWICQVIASDAFQSRLAERKNEIIDPTIRATVEERLKGLVLQSIEKLKQKLDASPSDDLTLGVLNSAAKALGYGAKQAPTVNNNFVVQIPGKSATSEEWVAAHSPLSAGGNAPKLPLSGISRTVESNSTDAAIVAERTGRGRSSIEPTQQLADKLLAELVTS